ncbi:TPA: four-carbon acid sugar kinase family protein, partial [Klebsiella quasipneumoniae]|nr:four-carbon acid sugar kinase family protein [Klebsiella quasipneumoniae]
GGDVAIAVAQALGATGFQIRGRVAECVPYGYFLGGRWSRPVMTKAGGFGTDTTLLHVVNFIEEKLSV